MVKVLDFGLAKALDHDLKTSHLRQGSGGQAGPQDLAASPTVTSPAMTRAGVILGTAAYMSPEQARGTRVDKRTDGRAFGCCLSECLAGRKPFRGDTVTDLMAEVLRSEPDWAALPADVPREGVTLLRRCLEKDPRRRRSSLGDIAILLEDSTQSRQPGPITPTATEAKRSPEPSKRPSLDLVMPRQGGVETLRQIRSLDPEARVILCSSIRDEATIVEAVGLGARDYVLKPIQAPKLLDAVEKALVRPR